MIIIDLLGLILVFVLLSILDYILTQKIIAKGGKELNPFLNFVGMLPGKIISAVIVGVAYILIPFIYIFVVADVILLGVCIWNFFQWKKQWRR